MAKTTNTRVTLGELEKIFAQLKRLGDSASVASEETLNLQYKLADLKEGTKEYTDVKDKLKKSQIEEKRLKDEINKETRKQTEMVGDNTQAFKTLIESTREFNIEAKKVSGEYKDMAVAINNNVVQYKETGDILANFTAKAEQASDRLERGDYTDDRAGLAQKKRDEKTVAMSQRGQDTVKALQDLIQQNQQNISKIGTDEFKALSPEEMFDLEQKILNLKKSGVKISKATEKQLLKMLDTQRKQATAQENSNKAINKTMDLTKKVADGFAGVLEQVPLIGGMMGGYVRDKFEEFSGVLRKKVTNQLMQNVAATKGMGKGFKGTIPAIRAMGAALHTATGGLTLFLGLLAAIVVAAVAAFTKIRDTSKELGITLTQSAKLQGTLLKADFLMVGLGQSASAISGELIDAFGTLEKVTTGNIVQIGRLSTRYGASTKDIISIQKQLMDMTGASADASTELIRNIGNLAVKEGVTAGNVIADIAANMATFAEFSTMGAEGLAEAAVQAAKVGASLSTVTTFAEKLLNFEQSISSEFEAQVLTGKSLNLERARELALQGKMGELAEELKSTVGGLGELQSMTVVEKRAISAAIGVSVADLQKISRGEAIEQKKTQESLLQELINVNKKGFAGNQEAFGKGDSSFQNYLNYGT